MFLVYLWHTNCNKLYFRQIMHWYLQLLQPTERLCYSFTFTQRNVGLQRNTPLAFRGKTAEQIPMSIQENFVRLPCKSIPLLIVRRTEPAVVPLAANRLTKVLQRATSASFLVPNTWPDNNLGVESKRAYGGLNSPKKSARIKKLSFVTCHS